MQVKNVVIVNDFNYIQGGASKVAIDTANLLVEKNIKVYFFSAVSKESDCLDKRVINISTKQEEALSDRNRIRGILNGLYNFKAKKEFEKILEKLDVKNTIIHFHGWTKALSSSVFDIAFKKGFKTVLTLHDYFTACPNGGYFNYKKNEICKRKPLSYKCIKCNCDSRNYIFKIYRIIRQFIQNKIVKLNDRLDNVISVSEFSKKILEKTLNKDINIKTIYNPIGFKKNEAKINYRNNEYYLYVGRVSKEKGVETFCKAIYNTGENGVVVGDGPEKEYLEKKYNKIEFTGWKDKESVKEYIKKAKALIFPSLVYETAGLTAIEAQFLGVPCITNANCAASEFVNKENIYNNFEELCEKIKENDYFLNKNIIPDDYCENVFEYYNQILGG